VDVPLIDPFRPFVHVEVDGTDALLQLVAYDGIDLEPKSTAASAIADAPAGKPISIALGGVTIHQGDVTTTTPLPFNGGDGTIGPRVFADLVVELTTRTPAYASIGRAPSRLGSPRTHRRFTS
jgi:hypothetical protein